MNIIFGDKTKVDFDVFDVWIENRTQFHKHRKEESRLTFQVFEATAHAKTRMKTHKGNNNKNKKGKSRQSIFTYQMKLNYPIYKSQKHLSRERAPCAFQSPLAERVCIAVHFSIAPLRRHITPPPRLEDIRKISKKELEESKVKIGSL